MNLDFVSLVTQPLGEGSLDFLVYQWENSTVVFITQLFKEHQRRQRVTFYFSIKNILDNYHKSNKNLFGINTR